MERKWRGNGEEKLLGKGAEEGRTVIKIHYFYSPKRTAAPSTKALLYNIEKSCGGQLFSSYSRRGQIVEDPTKSTCHEKETAHCFFLLYTRGGVFIELGILVKMHMDCRS